MKQTRKDQDRMNNRHEYPLYTAYIPIREGQTLKNTMNEELISLRKSPPSGQKSIKVSIKVKEVVCPKCS